MIILGIDIGVSSLGTAIVDTQKSEIIHTGVYVFPAGKDDFGTTKEASKNTTRRVARQMRRQNFRKRLRKYHLLKFLDRLSDLNSPNNDRYVPLSIGDIEGWLAWDPDMKSFGRKFPQSPEMREWFALNPYEIRNKALSEDITRREFGRLLYHMIQRRGFQSSRKVKEEGAMAKGSGNIIGYKETTERLGGKTLGQYLHEVSMKEGERYIEKAEKPRGRYTLRRMYVEELEKIWQRQAEQLGIANLEIDGKGVKELLMGKVIPDPESGEIRYKSNESVLFWQRPLRSQKHLINKCSLESRKMYDPEKKREYIQGPRVAAVSHPISEYHRVLQALSQIRVEGRTLYDMGLLESALNFLVSKNTKTVKIADLKKHLRLAAKLNYATEADLTGCPTITGITSLFKKGELTFRYGENEDVYIDIWQKLQFFEDQEMLEENLKSYAERRKLALIPDFRGKLKKLTLTEGYGSLSIHAMNNIIPFLLKGYSHTESIFLGGVKNALGVRYPYLSDDEKLWNDIVGIINQPAIKGEKTDNLIAFLSDPKLDLSVDESTLRLKLYHPNQTVQKIEARNRLGKIDNLRNPLVEQALWAVRRQVNTLIDMMSERTGNSDFRFDRITIELSRDLKASLERRNKIRREQKSNEAENDEAVRELTARGLKVNRNNIQKYRLFKELQEQNGIARCPYTGKIINIAHVFDGNNYFQIEHIIPESISLDDSLANKTLCDSDFNRDKSNMTPYEFYKKNSDPMLWGADDWEAISIRARRLLPPKKANRFLSKKSPEEQLENLPTQMLNDTAYMSVKAKEYLETICTDIRSVNGHITSDLRRMWGMNRILKEPYPVDPDAMSDDLIDSGVKEVYAILDNENQRITKVIPKFFLLPDPEPDEIRIPVTIDGKKLMRGKKEFKRPKHLKIENIKNDAILSFRDLEDEPRFELLFNKKPRGYNKLIVPVMIDNKGAINSNYIDIPKKSDKIEYPADPGKYWVTMDIGGEPIWELPNNETKVKGKIIRIAGKLNGNKFWSPIFEAQVSDDIIHLVGHRNRTALVQPLYDTMAFTKMLRTEPIADDNEIVLTGIVSQGFFILDDSNEVMVDIRGLGLEEQTMYYAIFRHGVNLPVDERVKIYPLHNEPLKASSGETPIEGQLFLSDRAKNLFSVEPVKNRDDHRHHAVDALVIALTEQKYVTALSSYNRERDEYRLGYSADRPIFEVPWEDLREDAQKSINSILVTHKPKRLHALNKVTKKISKNGKVYVSNGYAVRGALHKETIYGRRKPLHEKEFGYHTTKEISSIDKMSTLNKVVDKAIRNEMLRILRDELGLDINNDRLSIPKDAFMDKNGKTKIYLPNRKGGEKVPVKKVRIRENINNVAKLKSENQYVNPRNNHHAIIYMADDGSIKESVVTFWEVINREKRREEIFQMPVDGRKILYKFMINGMYIIGLTKQELMDNLFNTSFLSKYLYRVQKLSSKYYYFRKANASRIDDDSTMVRIQSLDKFHPNNDNIHHVEYDITGKIQLLDD